MIAISMPTSGARWRRHSHAEASCHYLTMPADCRIIISMAGKAYVSDQIDYTHHAWPGAWICSLFRREPSCPQLASDLIKEAVAVTRWRYGKPPEKGFVTFIDRDKTNPKRDPGYCYLMAGVETVIHPMEIESRMCIMRRFRFDRFQFFDIQSQCVQTTFRAA